MSATQKTTQKANERRHVKSALQTYHVELMHTQYSRGTAQVQAASEKEAREKADEIEAGDINFNPIDGEIEVVSIYPQKGAR